MEESAMKGKGSDAGIGKSRMFCRICVTGYPTRLREYDLSLALRKHFASCGDISDVEIPRDYERGTLKRRAFMSIRGESPLKKALELNGSEVELGGWTVMVSKARPYPDDKEPIDPARATYVKKNPIRGMMVTGYDTSLPKIDIMIGLSRYFSSCGDIWSIRVLGGNGTNRIAIVSIIGEDAIEKALALSGSNLEGWKIDVVKVIPDTHHPHPPIGFVLSKEARMRMMMNAKKKKNICN